MKLISLNQKIQKNLLRWFKKNQRDLPWRETKDPYAIWISEIMLQQTQVATVIPYYQKFLKTFPTLHSLAKARLSKVLKIWEGLGYYSRARNLHHASRIILNDFHGNIPENLKDLLNLPGIGRYTAGAILSIAFNKESPILDGNVKRVLARVFAIPTDPRKKETENFLWRISNSLIPKGKARLFNQALMDLGALICTPKKPHCPHCPLRNLCKGFQSGKPENYPLQHVRARIPHFTSMAVVVQNHRKFLLTQRPPKGLLGGLWEFPNWKIEKRKFNLRNEIKKGLGAEVEIKYFLGTFTQSYSHFKLTLNVYYCQYLNGKVKGKWITLRKLKQLPMSKIHRNIADGLTG